MRARWKLEVFVRTPLHVGWLLHWDSNTTLHPDDIPRRAGERYDSWRASLAKDSPRVKYLGAIAVRLIVGETLAALYSNSPDFQKLSAQDRFAPATEEKPVRLAPSQKGKARKKVTP